MHTGNASPLFPLRYFTKTLRAAAILATVFICAPGTTFAQTPAASIANVTLLEGNTGTTDFVFTVTLSEVPTAAASVEWATEDGSAVSPDDFAASSGTVNFDVGETTGTITVAVVADRIYENTEYFRVNLSNPDNCTISDSQAIGYITNDDVRLSIANLTQIEGNTGTTDFVFTVTLSGTYEFPVSVEWATADGAAVSPDDYAASSGTVNIDVGETAGTLTVPVVADRIYEGMEYFYVNLSNPVNCSIYDGSAAGYITNDDVRVSIADVSLPEGNTGTTDFIFAVTLSGAYEFPVSVDWATADGAAVAPDDYAASSGTVDFDIGETSATVTVPVVADRIYEGAEYFRVNLSNPVNCSIYDGMGTGYIQNDDVRVSIADVSLPEGNTGTTDFIFAVTLSGAYEFPVSVDWATADGAAVAPDDYAASSGTVDFDIGETSATVTVPVVADRIYEGTEYFRVNLSNPVNCSIYDGMGTGYIQNDDVRVSIADVSLPEGNTGTTDFVFAVTLSGAYEFPVSVDWATADGSAVAPDDYAASSGTVNFDVGETSGSATVAVVGDGFRENLENFSVTLSNPVNASLGDGIAYGYIENDDQYPAVSVADLSADEGHTGTTEFQFAVTLSADYVEEVQINYYTIEGSATAPEDYQFVNDTIIFPIGETEGIATVSVVGDYEVEPDETFEVHLGVPVHCTIGDGSAVGTIVNDDNPEDLAIADATELEGDTGTTEMQFDVTLGEASMATVQVDWATADGTAIAGEDYEASSGVLIYTPGETLQTISVYANGDVLDECSEDFYVELSNPVNSTIFDGQGVGTIQNDDLLGCADADGDCYHDEACGGRDCDDTDDSVYPNAPEVNDGSDNQCPGELGHGVVDEISGVCGFHDNDTIRFSWPEQEGAATYEVARSSVGDFSADCILWPPTALPYIDDVETPELYELFYYLVRPLTPLAGSWGQDWEMTERSFVCPTP